MSEFAAGLVFRSMLPPATRCRWAWLADTHISGDLQAEREGWRPALQLGRIAERLSAAFPHGLLVNGDIAWSAGTVEDYRRFRALMRPAANLPMVLGVGNHDCRSRMLAVLAGRPGPEPSWLASVVEQPPYRFVVLDSQVDGRTVGGEVGSEQLAWLRALVQRPAQPRTILFVHHPGRSISEDCRDFDALARLADSCECVEAIVTGHDHAFTLDRYGGVHLIGLPSCAFPFRAGTDCGWIETTLSVESIHLAFHGTAGDSERHLLWR